MCQLCEEANLYLAQLEAAERKAAESRVRGDDRKAGSAAGKPDAATATAAK